MRSLCLPLRSLKSESILSSCSASLSVQNALLMPNLRWKNLLPPVLYYLLILSVSALPASRIKKMDDFFPLPNDKVLHLAVYTGFGFVLGGLPFPSAALGMAGSLLGGLDEQSQQLSPGRDVSIQDWLADILGIAIGLTLRRRPR